MERLLVLIIRGVFNGDGVVTLTNFVALFALPFPSAGTFSSRGGKGGSETNFTTSSCSAQHM
jgi:hypothetical protein